MTSNLCGTCHQPTPRLGIPLKCRNCNKVYHKKEKCSSMNATTVRNILNRNFEWLCSTCVSDVFPFTGIETSDLIDIFSPTIQIDQPKPNKKTKCNYCMKKVKQNVSFLLCQACTEFYHLKCNQIKKDEFPLPSDWLCIKCSLNSLPFSNLSDNNFLPTLQGFSNEDAEKMSHLPSFTIQSLLDQLPGKTFSTDEFLSDSIE